MNVAIIDGIVASLQSRRFGDLEIAECVLHVQGARWDRSAKRRVETVEPVEVSAYGPIAGKLLARQVGDYLMVRCEVTGKVLPARDDKGPKIITRLKVVEVPSAPPPQPSEPVHGIPDAPGAADDPF